MPHDLLMRHAMCKQSVPFKAGVDNDNPMQDGQNPLCATSHQSHIEVVQLFGKLEQTKTNPIDMYTGSITPLGVQEVVCNQGIFG